MTRNEMAELSRDELIDLILMQAEQKAVLQSEVEALRKKLEQGKKPPTNSGNSSQPPSRDWKGDMPVERKKRRRGPPQGHPKHERKLVVNPDHIVEVKPRVCHTCQCDLSQESGVLMDINQITELPIAKAEVIEVRQYAVECPCCGQGQLGEVPAGLEMERSFGARLEATVVYYRQEQHMSYVRTQSALQNLHGVAISQGGIDQIMQRAGSKAIQEVKVIEQDIQQSAVIHSDETGSRVDGNNWWQWVFCSLTAVLHVMRFNRSAEVVKDVMGEHAAEVWISDCYLPQMQAPSKKHQLCLAHQLRNLQAVVEQVPKHFWARHVQILFRYAIHLHHQRQTLSEDAFANRVARIERRFDQLLQQNLDPPEARRLQRRYQKYRDAIFVFLDRTDVSPTNNLSERYLRPAVIHRKISGGFRSVGVRLCCLEIARRYWRLSGRSFPLFKIVRLTPSLEVSRYYRFAGL
jgi:transposase